MPVHQRYKEFQADQRKFFDELITEDWGTYCIPEWDFSRAEEIKQTFHHIKPQTILDIGCGDGFRDKIMAEYPFVKQVDAFDYSEQSILKANQFYPHPKVNRFVADLADYKNPILYDMVISFQVVEHLFEVEKYFDLCQRSCKPDGFSVIWTPNRHRIDNLVNAIQGKPMLYLDIMHYKEYTFKELVKLSTQYGFIPYRFMGHGFNPITLWGKTLLKFEYKTQFKLGEYIPYIASEIGIILKKIK